MGPEIKFGELDSNMIIESDVHDLLDVNEFVHVTVVSVQEVSVELDQYNLLHCVPGCPDLVLEAHLAGGGDGQCVGEPHHVCVLV